MQTSDRNQFIEHAFLFEMKPGTVLSLTPKMHIRTTTYTSFIVTWFPITGVLQPSSIT